MTEQEMVADFKSKIEEINSAVRRLAEIGISVDWNTISYQQMQWKVSANILTPEVIKVL